MKLLSLHCDYLKVEPKKKALKGVESIDKNELVVEEPLVVFVAVEGFDESEGEKKSTDWLVEQVLDLRKKIGEKKIEKIVLYPYAHLSSDLSSPDFAIGILEGAEKKISKGDLEVYRAPFGYYKSFELKCKGHPLSELTRRCGEESCSGKGSEKKVIDLDNELIDSAKLLRQISKAKLDTSKLKENDHRILGRKLDLFSFNDVAPGMVFWHNNGLTIKKELMKFWREEHERAGYEEISTPQIMDSKLWKISGHWDKYKENNFVSEYEGRPFLVKPMNCPGGMLVFKNSPKSYRDLPLRVGEVGVVHRNELSGVLSGLFRLIQFTQDDAHIFCTEKQLEAEIVRIIELIEVFYNKFGVEFDHVELSTRPEKRIGDEKLWDRAEKTLEKVLKKRKMNYVVNEGDGAFYGPKIDFHVKDSQGRTWQLSTIQLDMALPERFDLEYTGEKGKKQRPVMLHRVIYGAIERFLGILLEHTNGALPTWLSPVQCRVLSFTDRNVKAAEKVLEKLKSAGVRVDADFDSNTMQDKVRRAEMMKIPYMITIGDKEEEKGTIAVRRRGEKKLNFGVKLEDFVGDLKKEISERV